MSNKEGEPTMTMTELRAMDVAVLNMRQAAALFGVDPRTITRGIEEGTIPSVRIGNRILIPREPLLRLLEGKV